MVKIGVMPMPPASRRYSGRSRLRSKWLPGVEMRELGARREAPHVGGAAAAVAEEFYRNPVEAVRAGTDDGIGAHVRPPADLHRHIDVAAGRREHEVPRRLDLEEPDIAGEIPRPSAASHLRHSSCSAMVEPTRPPALGT